MNGGVAFLTGYFTTACVHEYHDKCTGPCEYCGTRCECPCHD